MARFLRIKNQRPAISSHWKDFGDSALVKLSFQKSIPYTV
jgi:hypothetical protein